MKGGKMIVIMNHRATPEQIQTVINHVESLGYRVHRSDGTERTILGIIGDERPPGYGEPGGF
jgi:3-deoxy-7-phosphoheptulonate synthase